MASRTAQLKWTFAFCIVLLTILVISHIQMGFCLTFQTDTDGRTGEMWINKKWINKNWDKNWEEGIEFEVGYWQRWLESKGHPYEEDYIKKMTPSRPMLPYLMENQRLQSVYPDSNKTHVLLLDCGAGPLTHFGTVWGRRKVEVTAVDPLAKEYNNLIRAFNLTPPVWTQYAPVEDLEIFFPKDFFSIVTMSNALDHSVDPIQGIRQMLNVLRRGGPVVLFHHLNESVNEKGRGFHKWNIDHRRGDMILWNDHSSFNINELFRHFATVESSVDGDYHFAWLWKL